MPCKSEWQIYFTIISTVLLLGRQKLSIYLVLVRDLGQARVKVRDLEVYISSVCWVLALGIYLYFPLCSPQCPCLCPFCLTHSRSSAIWGPATYLPAFGVQKRMCSSGVHHENTDTSSVNGMCRLNLRTPNHCMVFSNIFSYYKKQYIFIV